jgi:hypothetical protein
VTDELRTSCGALAAPTIALMGAAMQAQGNPAALPGVVRAVDDLRRALAAVPETGVSPSFDAWRAQAPALLDEMTAAAESRDPAGVWKAFTDPVRGLDQLGQSCAGQPGW